jgi:predicted AAA+ superfamily ATPase
MIERPQRMEAVAGALDHYPVAAILGPRQCGKTTLARAFARDRECVFFDLENPVDAARLATPMLALEDLTGLVVIDEIQRKPEMFSILRVLVDRPESNARFLVLGSASPYLVKGASESLAGRIGFIDLSGFSLSEVGADRDDNLWNRGGFPRSFLAADDALSAQWRNDFIRTFLERDIPQLGITIPAETLRRFWTMIAHFHGQVWNAATFARSLGVSAPTARRYLDILSGAFMVRQIQPWHANIKKRQVKSPRIYLRDSGLLHTLLSLQTMPDVLSHPKVGASWEGFVIEEILASVQSRDFYFWSTYSGAELDGLLFRRGRAVGFEIKRTDAPIRTKSMVSAIQELDLEHLYVVYPGKQSYRVDNRITALSVRDLDGVLAGEG